jgi:hypothetical protein
MASAAQALTGRPYVLILLIFWHLYRRIYDVTCKEEKIKRENEGCERSHIEGREMIVQCVLVLPLSEANRVSAKSL